MKDSETNQEIANPVDEAGEAPVQEEVAVEEEDAVRNEPTIGTHEQTIKPIEEPENRIQEDLGTNSLLGPRPSELRDDSDASAVENERG